jgi:hypothetical protein
MVALRRVRKECCTVRKSQNLPGWSGKSYWLWMSEWFKYKMEVMPEKGI